MKIGIMAYHSACNFGATLQLLSTYMYLKNHGHQPMVINWVASGLDAQYGRAPGIQQEMQVNLRRSVWTETALCRTSSDVANVIKSENIEAVIIGSDAVCQHHTKWERTVFPCKRVFAVKSMTDDRLYPNPFWATWNDELETPVPVAVLSASNQDSQFQYFSRALCRDMARRIKSYSYASVRDTWTRDMFAHITRGEFIPEVTPDPVFAFGYNAESLLPTKEELLEKYNLPEKYMLLTFMNGDVVSNDWLKKFEALAEKDGVRCVKLPFSDKESFGELKHQIHLPLSPIDWFALIKYSCGYVGNNMHPIVVSLHTGAPFFSFDNYGLKKLNGLYITDKSSKIKHILTLAGYLDSRVSCIQRGFKAPDAEYVYAKVRDFDNTKSKAFAKSYYSKYTKMMNDIVISISK